jgi:hypothetical protein
MLKAPHTLRGSLNLTPFIGTPTEFQGKLTRNPSKNEGKGVFFNSFYVNTTTWTFQNQISFLPMVIA